MDFVEYQQRARETAIYPNVGSNLWYPALGLAGEAGEVAEKIKKIYRDSQGEVSPEKKMEIANRTSVIQSANESGMGLHDHSNRDSSQR